MHSCGIESSAGPSANAHWFHVVCAWLQRVNLVSSVDCSQETHPNQLILLMYFVSHGAPAPALDSDRGSSRLFSKTPARMPALQAMHRQGFFGAIFGGGPI